MECIVVCGVDIFLLSGHDDLDFVFILPRGLDGTQVALDFVVTFCASRDVVYVRELKDISGCAADRGERNIQR